MPVALPSDPSLHYTCIFMVRIFGDNVWLFDFGRWLLKNFIIILSVQSYYLNRFGGILILLE